MSDPGPTDHDAAPKAEGPDEEALAAFIGPSWDRYYRVALGRYRFNFAAAVLPFWLAWRRLIGAQLLALAAYLVLWFVTADALTRLSPSAGIWLFFALPFAALGLLEGALANALIKGRATRAWQAARGVAPDRTATLAAMRRAGGVSPVTAGVMGGAAALAAFMYLFGGPSSHKHLDRDVAAMGSDLRNLVIAQDVWFLEYGTYTTTMPDTIYLTSPGVTVTILSADSSGWSATARYAGSSRVCGIFHGKAEPPLGARIEGDARCP